MISETHLAERLSSASASAVALESAPGPAIENRLLNRELSLIEFFRQVLAQGLSDRNPLLERLRFLTIFSSIVDEFFMVRVSGLKEEVDAHYMHQSPDGMTPEQQLAEIRLRLEPMMADCARGLVHDVMPALARHGIVIESLESLAPAERSALQ